MGNQKQGRKQPKFTFEADGTITLDGKPVCVTYEPGKGFVLADSDGATRVEG